MRPASPPWAASGATDPVLPGTTVRIEGSQLRGASTTQVRFADITFEGALGNLKLDEAAAVHLKTDAGDVEIGRLTGDATITTRKGDIRINEAGRGRLTLRTDLGNVTVNAAPGISATLDAGTSHGRIHNTLKNSEGPAAELEIHATTGYGNIEANSL